MAYSKESGSGLAFIGGFGLGAGLMYLLDPDLGARRRAMVRDQAVHAAHSQSLTVEKAFRDLSHRSEGWVARMGSALRPDDAPDEVIAERVRAKLGRVVSHPSSIEVRVIDGTALLTGPILAAEVDLLVRSVSHVRGVRGVENKLDVYTSAENIPGLQGEPRHRPRSQVMQESWTPSLRLLATGAGLSLSLYGLRNKGLFGTTASIAGIGLLVRSMTNLPTRRLVGVGAGHRAVDLQKTITVHAPVDQVFRFWTQLENFPRFMDHVKSIEVLEDLKRYRWKVAGPGGVPFTWDAEVTRYIENEVFAWKTLPGASVENAGIIRFEPTSDGSTRLNIRMSYNPPVGAVGHAVASLFRTDPKAAMDDDLVRMKSLLEDGKTSAHGEKVSREDVTGTRGSWGS